MQPTNSENWQSRFARKDIFPILGLLLFAALLQVMVAQMGKSYYHQGRLAGKLLIRHRFLPTVHCG